MPDSMIDAIASEAVTLLGTGRQTSPFSSRHPGFGLADAYRVTPAVRRLREERGEHPIGRKIGFTNRTIWAEYQVFAPIWGYMYDKTVFELGALAGEFSLQGLSEPRLEPEIAFHFMTAPRPGMSETELFQCIDWVAHGFEIVQSIFPAWKFTAADTVAAYGLHGAYLLGPRYSVREQAGHWLQALAGFGVELHCNGELVARGHATDVLDGPLPALKHLNDLLALDSENPPLAAGEIVTTGTLTVALPTQAGDRWSTRFGGIGIEGISIAMT